MAKFVRTLKQGCSPDRWWLGFAAKPQGLLGSRGPSPLEQESEVGWPLTPWKVVSVLSLSALTCQSRVCDEVPVPKSYKYR